MKVYIRYRPTLPKPPRLTVMVVSESGREWEDREAGHARTLGEAQELAAEVKSSHGEAEAIARIMAGGL